MIRFNILIFVLLLSQCYLTVSSFAQKLSFEAFTAEDGLSKNHIGSITQDHYGFIWVGTNHGLNLYDSYQFHTYYHDSADTNSISNNVIHKVYTDREGTLWVGTDQGLNQYDVAHDAFIHFEALADRQIYTIYEDMHGVLWVGTDQGIFFYYKSLFQSVASTKPYHVRALAQLSNEQLLIATDEGLFEASTDGSAVHEVSAVAGVAYISDLTLLDDKVWVATREKGIYALGSNGLELDRHYLNDPENSNSLDANDVLCLLKTSEGHLWAGTDLGGLHKLDSAGTGFIHYTGDSRIENSLSSNNILSLFEDKDQNLWIGTNHGGLNFSAKDQFFQYYKSNPHHFRSSSVHAVFRDRNDNLWIGTGGNGLTVLSDEGKLIATYDKNAEDKQYRIEGNTIQTIAEDKDGRIWVGIYEHGISVIEPGKGVIKSVRTGKNAGLRHDDVRKILLDHNDRLWIATKGGGLHTYQAQEDKIVPIELQKSDQTLDQMFIWLHESTDGKLWVGNHEGSTFYIEPDTKALTYQLHKAPWPTLPSLTTAILDDEQGNYWIGTWDKGLYRWNSSSHKLYHYGQQSGINDNEIRGVLGMGKDVLWISTSSGLAKYQPGKDSFKWYDSNASIKYPDFLFGAAHQTRDGTFFFGSGQGMYAFKADQQFEPIQSHKLYLSGLKVMGKEVEVGSELLPKHIAFMEEVALSPQHSVFTIDFIASHYPRAGHQKYAVKLEGFEDEWRNLGDETSATYTNIKPGEYRFRVKTVVSNSSPELQQEAAVNIVIHPPFWETTLAFILYTLALVIVILLARKFTIARIQLKNDLLQERKEREREEEVHKMKLNFFTGLSHEFRTPLMLIINPLEQILKAKKEKAIMLDRKEAVMMERNAQRLLRLVNQLLTFRKLETSHDELHLSVQDVRTFVQHVFQYFEDLAEREKIDFHFTIADDLPQLCFDGEKMETVLYNLLSNAFKFTPPYGTIKLSVEISKAHQDMLKINVEDNGIGIPQHLQQYVFDRYYQVDEHHMNGNSGTGIGLALVKKIVEMHDGEVSVQSREGQGSCFTVSLPIKTAKEIPFENQSEIILEENNAWPLAQPDLDYYTIDDHSTTEEDKKRATILIVDDNHEIRSYLKSSFSSHFNVLEASNGKVALDIIKEQTPALIISDVMMPEMDGIAFCKKVKSNLDTHHIPVILLTARSGEESMLQALRAGADDYLEKPIRLEALLLKVKNTLSYRREVKRELSRDLIPDPQTETYQTADQEFMDDAMKVVEQNIENAEFSVEEYAELMGVSKTHLYNKLKALTGLSANEFTRSIRMKKAASLLEQERWSVSEVAYMVGFNNPNYFSKCFIREYGISPSKFEGQQHNQPG